MKDIIAERKILCIEGSGGEKQVTILVGKPYQNEKAWSCPIELKNLYDKLHDSVGEDSFQSLTLALKLLRSLLEDFVEHGGKIFSFGKKEVTISDLFDKGL